MRDFAVALRKQRNARSGTIVEQSIAQREVKQLLLPLLKALFARRKYCFRQRRQTRWLHDGPLFQRRFTVRFACVGASLYDFRQRMKARATRRTNVDHPNVFARACKPRFTFLKCGRE